MPSPRNELELAISGQRSKSMLTSYPECRRLDFTPGCLWRPPSLQAGGQCWRFSSNRSLIALRALSTKSSCVTLRPHNRWVELAKTKPIWLWEQLEFFNGNALASLGAKSDPLMTRLEIPKNCAQV